MGGNSSSKVLSYHEKLGEGAFSEVWRVTWRSTEGGPGVNAAAKKIRFDTVQEKSDFWDDLKREIDALKRLEHENIVRYYDTLLVEPHVIIITEFVAQGSLFNYLKKRESIPQELVKKWALHLSRGIQFIQQSNIVHRDIKSSNCVISANDVLKICDFGLAKDLTKTKSTDSEKGTVKWLAPEVFTEGKLSPKADIYAFGIVLWELNSCEEPYRGMRPETVMFQVGEHGIRPEIPESCIGDMRDLIVKCWDVDRDSRPDIDSVIAQLEELP